MGTPQELAEAAEYAALAAGEENILYSEMILNPTHWPQFTVPEIIAAVTEGFDRGRAAGGADCRFTLSLSRTQTGEEALALERTMEMHRTPRLAGLSVDGNEALSGRTGERFRPAFLAAKAAGFGCTVHAGESSGPEGVRDAVDLLKADRLDHGVRAAEDPNLVERLARERVPLNICLTSKSDAAVPPSGGPPSPRLLDAGAAVDAEPGRPHLPGRTDADGGAAPGGGVRLHDPAGADPLSGERGGRRILRGGDQGGPCGRPWRNFSGDDRRGGAGGRIGWGGPGRGAPGTSTGNEGIPLRISEAYEHEPILPYQPEESCPVNGCNKVSTQCVDVTAPVILVPTAVMGSPHRHLPGQPQYHLLHQCRRHHVHRHPDPAGVRVHPGPLRCDHVYLRPHHLLRRQLRRLRLLLTDP